MNWNCRNSVNASAPTDPTVAFPPPCRPEILTKLSDFSFIGITERPETCGGPADGSIPYQGLAV